MTQTDPREAAIGVFDSGVGGLTVAGEIMRQLPNENIVYFGDTARVPYGSKSKETITRYSEQIIRFLLTKNIKAIVIACNTASSYALDAVRSEFDIPILGVIGPGASSAVLATKNKKIGVIGTEGTTTSKVYSRSIQKIDPAIDVIGTACPLFVPLVEEGWMNDPVTKMVASRYLEDLKKSEIDTLILGCTHYPHLRPLIGEIMGEGVTLVNPAYETARGLLSLLNKNSLSRTSSDTPKYGFYVSDTTTKFRSFANASLPCDVDRVEKINIEEY